MDRAKRGTKRSLLVAGGGVPVGLSVAGANRNDCKLLEHIRSRGEEIAAKERKPGQEARRRVPQLGLAVTLSRFLDSSFSSL